MSHPFQFLAESIIPTVVESDDRSERSFDIFSLLLKERIVFLGTQIDDQVANLIVAQLLFLQREDPERDISLYIQSPGGVIPSGLAALGSASASNKALATSKWRCRHAKRSAVAPSSALFSRIESAPYVNNKSTTAACPFREAIISAVVPSVNVRLGSAPAFSNNRTISVCPSEEAAISDVPPF